LHSRRRSTGLTKNISPLSLIKKRYSKVTGKTVCDRLFKNMRATRSKELTLVPGITHQTVCKWIGNTIAVSNEHYLTPSQSEHARAVALVTENKPTSKKDTNMWANLWAILPSPSSSTQLSDALENQVMKATAQQQPVQATLLLQELTTLLASTPDAASLLMSAISAKAKKPQSSSNRGRTCTPEGTGS
jgi:prophage DNA circulation protein